MRTVPNILIESKDIAITNYSIEFVNNAVIIMLIWSFYFFF